MPSLSIPTRRRFVQSGDVRLHVVEAGPTDGDPVILLHGFPEFWYGWRQQIPALVEAGYRVVVPDQRGYHRSDAPPEISAYDLPALVNDVRAVIASTGSDRAYVIGHDWGAAVAWALAAWHPEAVRRLAILNVPHLDVFRRTLRSSPAQLLRSVYILLFQIPRLPEWLLSRADHVLLTRLLTASGRRDTFAAEDLEVYRSAWRRPGRLRGMLNWYRAAARRAVSGASRTHRPADARSLGRPRRRPVGVDGPSQRRSLPRRSPGDDRPRHPLGAARRPGPGEPPSSGAPGRVTAKGPYRRSGSRAGVQPDPVSERRMPSSRRCPPSKVCRVTSIS